MYNSEVTGQKIKESQVEIIFDEKRNFIQHSKFDSKQSFPYT